MVGTVVPLTGISPYTKKSRLIIFFTSCNPIHAKTIFIMLFLSFCIWNSLYQLRKQYSKYILCMSLNFDTNPKRFFCVCLKLCCKQCPSIDVSKPHKCGQSGFMKLWWISRSFWWTVAECDIFTSIYANKQYFYPFL